jgi:hypothetical protein
VALRHEINPDPERIFYAHNTFVQAYLEQGPLGALGMLLIPVIGLAAAVLARRLGLAPRMRPLFIFGLGTLGALEAHGLTDQVVTTNVGTAMVLLALAATVGALSAPALARLTVWVRRAVLGLFAVLVLALLGLAALPVGRAQALLNLGGLQANRALLLPAGASERAVAIQAAESTLDQAAALDPGHPAVLRNLARVRAAHFDDIGALEALKTAAASPRVDAFDMLQIAHLYRDAGFAQPAYALAARAYELWGRSTEDVVMRTYAENTLRDDEGGHRARILAQQAEAAMQARAFGQAAQLFQQALTFAPDNAYLQDRAGAAQRAIARYGEGEPRSLE